jgi:hypothetical protein
MKIVCDCGQEIEFIKTGDKDSFGESDHTRKSISKISISCEHDEGWITCSWCGESIHFFA